MNSQSSLKRDLAQVTDDLPEIVELENMTVNQLVTRYCEVFNEPTRSRNRQHLVRSIAWRIQELAFGGLSSETLAKLAALSAEAPRPWRRRLLDAGPRQLRPRPLKPAPPPPPPKPRDPRLPPEGTVLRRVYRRETHEVLVREDDFLYRGKVYGSLSALAREITGTSWNGFAFFRVATNSEAQP
jgi:hypothetical protein